MKKALLFWLCLSLSSCGFHLRGAYELPKQMQRTYLLAEIKPSALTQNLQRILLDNQIQLSESAADANVILHLYNEKIIRRIASVDAQGRAQEYALTYQLSFELNTVAEAESVSSGQTLNIKSQSLNLQKSYLFDPEDILGKAREEQLLIEDMQKDMVRLILLQLQLKAVPST